MYGEWCENDGSSRTDPSQQVNNVMDELRGFRPYLRQRLQYKLDSNRSLEFQDEVADIEFYMTVMAASDADRVHGLDGLQGFVQKLYEMRYKKPIPKGFKFKSENGNSSGTSNMDDNYSQEEWEKGIVVGELEKRIKRGKEIRDSRIAENLRSLRDPETEPGEPEPEWLIFHKSEIEKELGNKAPPSASGVTASSVEQQPISQPVSTPEWLEDTTDHTDPLIVAGLEGICERREKKVDANPILKEDNIRKNPLYRPRPPQPFGPDQVRYPPPQAPAAYHPVLPTPGAYHCVPPTAGAYRPLYQAPPVYPSAYNTPLTATPPWMQDDPVISYHPTSYDYARNAPPGGIMRQPPLTTTYVAGYGNIEIIPPMQSNPNPPPRPRIQTSEYQIPRDALPNPFYNPRLQHRPVDEPQNHHYNRLPNDLHGNRRRSSFNQGYSHSHPQATTAPSSPGDESPDWGDDDDKDSSMSYGAYKKAQMHRKQVRFPKNPATVHHQKNRRYFSKEQPHRGDNTQRQTPHFNTKRRSTVRQILETGQQKMYKLGQHEKIVEEVDEADL